VVALRAHFARDASIAASCREHARAGTAPVRIARRRGAPFPPRVSLFGRTRDEFGNEMFSSFGAQSVDDMEKTETLKPGDSLERAVYATFPPVDEAQQFTWDQPFVVSQDGTVETLRVTFDRSSILPGGEVR
jgi:hypothetical protein